MATVDTSFYKRYLEENLQDAEFQREYESARKQIAQINAVMRSLDSLRAQTGISKAELARRIGKQPAALRRLFSSASNPELATIAAMAIALDAEIRIVPNERSRSESHRHRTRQAASEA